MKTLLYRVMTSSLAVATLVFYAGFEEETANAANADVPIFTNGTPAPAVGENGATPAPGAPEAKPSKSDPGDADAEDSGDKPKPARIVDEPVVPENLNISPALKEIIKLVQAGISEEVIMSYVTNSTNSFNVGSDQIVYLNDLGVSTALVTALIQHDSSSEAAARKKALATAEPLPPGVALTTPATNVYPGALTQEAASPPQTALPPSYEETAAPATVTYEQAPVNVSYFYSSLAPYGSWVDVAGYGLCWQPTVAVVNPAWRPYADRGRWLWSDYGWYWYSDYSWGWAPFHYGRWCTYPRLGWVWVPDTCWGPSWVTWRYNSSYCGWAPLPPACNYVSGFGLYYHSGWVGIGFDFGLSSHCWTYIRKDRFCDRRPHLYYASGAEARRLHTDTRPHTRITSRDGGIANDGIGRQPIANVTSGRVPTVRVRDTALVNQNVRRERLEGNDSSLVVTRPQLPTTPSSRPGIVAAKVSSEPGRNIAASSVKASPNRNPGDQPGNLLASRLAEQKPVRPVTPGANTVSPQSTGSPRLKDLEPAKARNGSAAAPTVRGAPLRPIAANQEPATPPVAKNGSTEMPAKADTPGTGAKSEAPSSISRSGKPAGPAANTRPAPQRPRSSTFTPPLILGADPAAPKPQAAPATRGSGNSLNGTTSVQAPPPRGGEGIRSGNSGQPAPSVSRQPLRASPTAPQAYGRPAGVPSSNQRAQTPAPSVSRPPERFRSYAEPPGASRSASPPQVARPNLSQPSMARSAPLPAPAAQRSFAAPRAPVAAYRSEPARTPAPAVRAGAMRAPSSAPAVRAESARSSAAAPSRSGSSGRSQGASNSGGWR